MHGGGRVGGGEGPVAQVVMRGRRGQSEAARDHEILRWIGRFRFVTASELSVRFGVSERRVNSRLARFIREGLVGFRRESMFHARIVWLTTRGAAAVELPRRKPPRADIHIRHELLVAGLAADIEVAAAGTGAVLWTERECRQAHDDHGERWCVEAVGHGGPQQRWPDLVVQVGERRRAVELELAVKHSSRMRAIVEAYADGLVFHQVLWLVELPTQRERVRAIAEDLGVSQEVMAWPAADAVAAATAPSLDRGSADASSDALVDILPETVTPREGPPPPRVAGPQSHAAADDELFSDEFVYGTR